MIADAIGYARVRLTEDQLLDPLSHELTRQGLGTAAETVAPLLQRLLGPACDEVGQALADRLRLWRADRTVRLLERAKAILQNAGLEPAPVALRTLLPLLEGASLEEDETLSEMWAALLANSAGARSEHPAFVAVLRQLSPVDAEALLLLKSTKTPSGQQLVEHFTGQQASLIAFNLQRLGLCRWATLRGELWILDSSGQNKVPNQDIELTDFGEHFLAACSADLQRPPAST